jgi:UDPglucose 6-dehydrogenase
MQSLTVTIIGSGYVGLTTGVCLAELGHTVICSDNDESKVRLLASGGCPIYEPGLPELMRKNAQRLSYTADIADAVRRADIIFVAVGTPSTPSGAPDMSYVERVARTIALAMNSYKLVVEKSTVPVQTAEWMKRTIARYDKAGTPFDVASNPEFLREGTAVQDFLKPDRIVLGVESDRARDLLLRLYAPIDAPKVVVDIKSAELIKHASNSFLAMKISFINAVATICELTGADIDEVAQGMGYDRRIGKDFLRAGVGYGGSCFPKDVDAFIWLAGTLNYDFALLKSVRDINREQRDRFFKKIEDALWVLKGKTVAVLGIAFKANTDDIREAPALDIMRRLLDAGACVRAYDPQAMDHARAQIPQAEYCASPYEAMQGADCAVIMTEWEEIRSLDLDRAVRALAHPIVVDGRNLFDPAEMKRRGFDYRSIGRGHAR